MKLIKVAFLCILFGWTRCAFQMANTSVSYLLVSIFRRQFKELADSNGFATTTDFARHVLSLPLEEQMAMLKNHYADKNPGIQEQIETYFELKEETDDEPKSKVPSRTARTSKPCRKTAGKRSGGRQTTQKVKKPAKRQVRKRPQPKEMYFDSEEDDSDDGDSDETDMEEKKVGSRKTHEIISTTEKAGSSRTQREIISTSDIEFMDMSDSDEPMEDPTTGSRQDQFTDLRQEQPSERSKEINNSAKRHLRSGRQLETDKPCADKPMVSTSSTGCQQQNMSFLDDIFLSSPDPKKVRKPPPKKKQSLKQQAAIESLCDEDKPQHTNNDSDDSDQSESMLGIETQNTLWKRNSRYGQKSEQLDAALMEDDGSVFHKYSSSFVVNKNFKKKLYRFDDDKDEILSETLSEDG